MEMRQYLDFCTFEGSQQGCADERVCSDTAEYQKSAKGRIIVKQSHDEQWHYNRTQASESNARSHCYFSLLAKVRVHCQAGGWKNHSLTDTCVYIYKKKVCVFFFIFIIVLSL